MLATRRAEVHDATLERRCSFACGVMSGLERHWFGRAPSRSAVGHAGWYGASFAFWDPEVDLVVSCAFNGIWPSSSAGPMIRRPRIVQAIYQQLDLLRRPMRHVG
jgi:hypothetical protein